MKGKRHNPDQIMAKLREADPPPNLRTNPIHRLRRLRRYVLCGPRNTHRDERHDEPNQSCKSCKSCPIAIPRL